jgi:hypothetical protein
MLKEKIVTIVFILFFLVTLLVVFFYEPSNCKYELKRVRIDSVSCRDRYTFLPDKLWLYYTKYGVVITSRKKYNVGDSIEIKKFKNFE